MTPFGQLQPMRSGIERCGCPRLGRGGSIRVRRLGVLRRSGDPLRRHVILGETVLVDDPRDLRGVVGIGGMMSLPDLLDEPVRVVRMREGRLEPRLGVQEPAVVVRRVLKRRIGPEAVRFWDEWHSIWGFDRTLRDRHGRRDEVLRPRRDVTGEEVVMAA